MNPFRCRRRATPFLLYPEWETGSHAPTASVIELGELAVQVDGRPVDWRRDAVQMHAFHIDVPQGGRTITLDFQFLAPQSSQLLRQNMVIVPWQRVLLYPAGWYVRDIAVAAKLTLPQGLATYTSLDFQAGNDGTVQFSPVTLERLVDAPVYAGRYTRRIALDGSATAPVNLDLLADNGKDLAISKAQIEGIKGLFAQGRSIFGAPPYAHYDAIVTLSDVLAPDGGGGGIDLEEGENNLPAAYFTEPATQLNNLDLIAHEYVHSWNGVWRTPEDLWTPDYNWPAGGSLLWVYEGQTEFWGRILAARADLRTRQQTLDRLALDADFVAGRKRRAWKDLQDSSSDAIYMAKHHVTWRSWQGREDYYSEGVLLWLDVDARLRELSHDQRGIDDFARRFFATSKPAGRTYNFQDVCTALNTVAPDDWAGFLNRHLHTRSADDALAGLARSGWKLVYTDVPTETFRQNEAGSGVTDLADSIGIEVDPGGRVQSVQWDGPAFRAGLAPGARLARVNGQAFSTEVLTEAVRASPSTPVSLSVKDGDGTRTFQIDYRAGLRYPHLERIAGTPDRLSALLEAR